MSLASVGQTGWGKLNRSLLHRHRDRCRRVVIKRDRQIASRFARARRRNDRPYAVQLRCAERSIIRSCDVPDGLFCVVNAELIEKDRHGNVEARFNRVRARALRELHNVHGEPVRLRLDRVFAVDLHVGGVELGHLGSLGGSLNVVDVRLVLVIAGLGHGKAHVNGLALGRLKLVAVRIEHLDVKGVANLDGGLDVAGLLHRLRLLLAQLDLAHVEPDACGEGTLVGVGIYHNAFVLQLNAVGEGGHGCLVGILIGCGLLLSIVRLSGIPRWRGLFALDLLLSVGLRVDGTLLLAYRHLADLNVLARQLLLSIGQRLRGERRDCHEERQHKRDDSSCGLLRTTHDHPSFLLPAATTADFLPALPRTHPPRSCDCQTLRDPVLARRHDLCTPPHCSSSTSRHHLSLVDDGAGGTGQASTNVYFAGR